MVGKKPAEILRSSFFLQVPRIIGLVSHPGAAPPFPRAVKSHPVPMMAFLADIVNPA